MSKATYPLKLPVSIKRAAERLTKADGVSLNRWIASAVAENVGAIETADTFFKARAKGAGGRDLLAILAKVLKREPDPRDKR